jgi:excisionase family DNA binding protein
MRYMMSVAMAAEQLGVDRETIRRWIRSGSLRAQLVGRSYAIDDRDLPTIEDELFPMAELPDEWKLGDNGSPAPNWVAALHRSRDHQAETVAIERIRRGATERTREGEEALAELGIDTH